jgi:hypothetical protein
MFRKSALITYMLLLGACCAEETSGTTTTTTMSEGGDGGTGGSETGGGGMSTSSGGDGGGGSETTTTTTTTQCQQSVCAGIECGYATADCDGDGLKEHIECGGCAAPEACMGSNELNKCGSRCLATPEYAAACGKDVEFACDDEAPGCGFCYKYGSNGKPVYKSVGVNCPKVTAPDGTEIRCCVPGCGGDC